LRCCSTGAATDRLMLTQLLHVAVVVFFVAGLFFENPFTAGDYPTNPVVHRWLGRLIPVGAVAPAPEAEQFGAGLLAVLRHFA